MCLMSIIYVFVFFVLSKCHSFNIVKRICDKNCDHSVARWWVYYFYTAISFIAQKYLAELVKNTSAGEKYKHFALYFNDIRFHCSLCSQI